MASGRRMFPTSWHCSKWNCFETARRAAPPANPDGFVMDRAAANSREGKTSNMPMIGW
jgi:hypothetical protein